MAHPTPSRLFLAVTLAAAACGAQTQEPASPRGVAAADRARLPPEQLAAWGVGQTSDVMEVLGEVTAPMFAVLDGRKLAAPDFAMIDVGGRRIGVLTQKLVQFYGFDDQPNTNRIEAARALSLAAQKQDETAVRAGLAAIRADCRKCHFERRVKPTGRQRALP